jgi:threonine efflux protein
MPYLPSLLMLAAVWIVVVITPGPNFLTAVSAATTRSRRDGVLSAFGIAIGDGIWASSSLLGLAVLLARYGWLADVVRFAGAGFLLLLGIRALLRSRRRDEPGHASIAAPGRARSALLTGLLVDLGNPKTAVFFTSLFAALLPAGAPLWVAVAAVGVIAVIPAVWYSSLACLFSTGRVVAGYQRMRRWVDAVTGGVFVALGIRVAAEG